MNEQSERPSDISLAFAESLYEDYLRDPNSVTAEWRDYFERLPERRAGIDDLPPDAPPAETPTAETAKPPAAAGSAENEATALDRAEKLLHAYELTEAMIADAAGLQHCIDKLVRAYRVRGHMAADLDPLGLPRPSPPELDPEYFGLTAAHRERPVSANSLTGWAAPNVGAVIDRLRETYCRSIGVQFMHIDDMAVREWLQKRMEGSANRLQLSRKRQLRILTRLTDAVIFEEFLQKKYVGAKSFSLEGCESLIPLLDLAIERAGDQGVDQVVLGMPHRGRLNMLVNILGKSAQEIFREFDDADRERHHGRGDVKYHLGYRSDWITAKGNKVHLALCFNPSHLEFVNPVAMGRMRAKQDRYYQRRRKQGLLILIHGDAAFAGQGVVQETLNLSELSGYTVGGTVHIVANNQIGFTTRPEQGRSTTYASGIAKMLQIPIFHVNGEDPESVAQVVRLAIDFRNTFHRDAVIDMYGYRRHGHNESDEPSFTQPLMVRAIAQRKSVHEGYLERLLSQGEVTEEEARRIAAERRSQLEQELSAARSEGYIGSGGRRTSHWSGYQGGADASIADVDTGVEDKRLRVLLMKLGAKPQDFQADRRIEKILKSREAMSRGECALDWAAAEALAFASILTDGIKVRITGQDCERGTFSHRHAVLRDTQSGKPYVPLRNLSPRQAEFEIHNSPLSEAGVLGFEWGYSLDWPDGLIVWEAQFGDFVNAAQVIVDQFIASGEDKWGRLSGLVMLLPHGFEGQGPEHSSARLERFLQLAAEDNMQVVNPTTPAQIFHVLRRQVVRPWRKPLVVMSPKSLLRHPRVKSALDELSGGVFRRILVDPVENPRAVKKLILCSGKVYYDLLAAKESGGFEDAALVRFEQLYPLSGYALSEALAPFPANAPAVWVQEEPENMGAWLYLRARFLHKLPDGRPFAGVFRHASASPATGSAGSHKMEQQQLIDEAFAPDGS